MDGFAMWPKICHQFLQMISAIRIGHSDHPLLLGKMRKWRSPFFCMPESLECFSFLFHLFWKTMDSTMMWIVHNAMNTAHEKMKSKEGVLERLNGMSRFYELAAMQLEGCLKFVRQETHSYILESSHEQVLSDLTEIWDRLQLRLKESEMAIKDKDRELDSLRANLNKHVRSKSDPLEEYMVSNRVSGDNDDRDSEFSELKNSVDQQVWHIRQQLEPAEYKFKGKEGNAEVLEGMNNKKIEHLDSDIGVLKQTLDLAFGKMQNAIFGSEVGPIEQQWRGDVETDTMSIVLEGFMRDFQENVEQQVWKKLEKKVCLGLKEYWSDLMNEVENLRRELEPLAVQNEVPKCKTNEKSSADDFGHANLEKQRSSKAEEVMKELHKEENKEEEGHFVSKMIKNHESIIRKKSVEAEELNILKREILQHKANLSSRREEDKFVKRRMQEVILRLDKLRDWDAKLQETFGNYDKFVHGEETPLENRSPKSDAIFSENLELDTLSEIWEKMDKVPYGVNEELQNEGSILKQEQEESNLEDVIMKEIYVTLLEGLVKENYIKVYDNELESLMWKDICQVLFKEVINQWKEKTEINNVESQTREEMNCTIYCTVLSEALKDYSSSFNIALAESQELRDENNLEAVIKEDICLILLREAIKEWNKWIEDYETACLLRQQVDQLVFYETIKDIVDTASYRLAQNQDIVARYLLQNTESFIKEDIYLVFIRETIEEWKMELSAFNMESHIREEIYQFVIVENVKDALVLFREEADSGNEDKFSKGMLFANKFHNHRQVSMSNENLNEKIGTPLICLEVEEDMVQSEAGQLRSSLGTIVGDLEKDYSQVTHEVGSIHYEEPSYCQPKENKEVQLNPSKFMFTPFLRFSEELVDLEHTTKEKLEMNFFRLDDMKHHLDELIELVSSLRKKESLYRDAFNRRCQDIQKAEIEVDLLADQVDVLVGLLEKIYTTLYHHSPILQQYFEVSDILQLIQKELAEVFDASND